VSVQNTVITQVRTYALSYPRLLVHLDSHLLTVFHHFIKPGFVGFVSHNRQVLLLDFPAPQLMKSLMIISNSPAVRLQSV
jgi:hypothetical protein